MRKMHYNALANGSLLLVLAAAVAVDRAPQFQPAFYVLASVFVALTFVAYVRRQLELARPCAGGAGAGSPAWSESGGQGAAETELALANVQHRALVGRWGSSDSEADELNAYVRKVLKEELLGQPSPASALNWYAERPRHHRGRRPPGRTPLAPA